MNTYKKIFGIILSISLAIIIGGCTTKEQRQDIIINNASKAKRDALLKVWPLISSKYDGVGIQILVHGNLQAVSEDIYKESEGVHDKDIIK